MNSLKNNLSEKTLLGGSDYTEVSKLKKVSKLNQNKTRDVKKFIFSR